jgi:L,D-peptidoglycan transpeptidase YkuD (ErfK/YbiS/YcfS/YnhG family)
MRRKDELYRRVIVVDHNPEPSPGAGSCIFLHLWHGPDGGGTAGCTAMSPAPMEALLAWLDPAARPVYVLLPADRAAALRTGWALP